MTAVSAFNAGASPKIDSITLTIADLLKDFYLVPDFQREYVWKPENVEQLLQDVFDEFFDEAGKLIQGTEYFIGSIVACPDEAGTFQLIDGQQRMTTIYLILCAIRGCFEASGVTPPGPLRSQIRAERTDPLTFATVFDYRLILQYEDSHDALEHIADGEMAVESIPPATASIRNMLAAYHAATEFISANFHDEPLRINQFWGTFTQRVKLIRIVTPSLAHALKVFETINDRGVGLNAMDLLKNLLFMKTGMQDYPTLKDRWKELTEIVNGCGEKPLRFLRYYILSHYEIDPSKGLREDEIYKWFFDHSHETGIDRAPLDFVKQLVSVARVYANLIAGRDPQGEANRYLRNLHAVSGSARQHFILILAGSHLPKPAFDELVRQIENLFFTFIVIREQTKTLERIFARGASTLRSVSTMDQLQQFMAQNITPELAARARAFDFSFRELTTDRIQQYRMRYILAKLTQYVDEQAWDRQAHTDLSAYLDSSIHVEHILPQSPAPGVREAFDLPDEYHAYVRKLGNLTLLEKTINTSVSNGPYQQKRPGYAKSRLLLTESLAVDPTFGANTQLSRAVRDLIQFDEWTSESVNRRQEMLVEIARKVWMRDISQPSQA